jgi:large subunit ribosomal protein L4
MNKKTTTKTTTNMSTAQTSAVSLADLNLDVSNKRNDVAGFSLWVRSLLQNWRQGTVACKGRSDVAKANRKPWKQKGTGRARAGSARSPLWRGGGVTFGPQPRVRTLTVSQKLKQGVLNTLLFNFVEKGNVHSLDWAPGDVPKTATAYAALKQAALHNKKVTLFLPVDDLIAYASFVNVPHVQILFFDQANAYDLAASNSWVFLSKDFDRFKEMASRWI